jgi:hypothetical protein
MFDAILVGTLAVALGFLLSGLLGYDEQSEALDRAYEAYEAKYGIDFDITQEEYLALPEARRQNYEAAIRNWRRMRRPCMPMTWSSI